MLRQISSRLFGLSRGSKTAIQFSTDTLVLSVSFVGAMLLRLDHWDFVGWPGLWYAPLLGVPTCLGVLAGLGFYRATVRYMTSHVMQAIAVGVVSSAAVMLLSSQVFSLSVPRSVPFIYAMLAFAGVGGSRFALRSLYLRGQSRQKDPVLIYGAGDAGRQLLSVLREGPDYSPVALVDDEPAHHGSSIAGLVVQPPERIADLVRSHGIGVILLAVPSASHAERAAILQRLEPLPVHVRTIPGMSDIVSGTANIGEIGEVAVEDLLGRDPVPPLSHLMDANIRGKVVMVTGAGGSIGGELCRQIQRYGPARLVLLDISEFGLYNTGEDLAALAAREGIAVPLSPVLGSVRDEGRMSTLIRRFGVDTIYHAAAYKHVPLVEENAVEGICNNVFGTLVTARAAIGAKVGAFILVSTDKAVRPTNIMGASKRMAELVCQALGREQEETRLSMVRFGNVLGSSGSVVPLFRRQIAEGGPVTVTHPEITRYFMTIPEAAQLVIQAGAMARGGDVFVLEMGQPVRIVDLATRLIRLSGLTPVVQPEATEPGAPSDNRIAISFTDLRPGEKLYEELLVGESARETIHPRIMTATEPSLSMATLNPLLERLRDACLTDDMAAIRDVLLEAPTGYALPSSHPAERARADTARNAAFASLPSGLSISGGSVTDLSFRPTASG